MSTEWPFTGYCTDSIVSEKTAETGMPKGLPMPDRVIGILMLTRGELPEC